ncbi:Aste57867_11058 [Aphanomyces stellatus]|uniref:Aste57867_11058 protein n=1 Tax=Aphanomyces stellatus TaxID=120398 RepID=A0A485KSN2_9STRA|nr:hypothetical protein As57867_011016 [Aphanomyces stellatus]VFT87926.1 Aste57867_11058 [Aphanomyces stellatus]
MQKEGKARYDPSEHAKKQQAAKERAKELRDARSRGVVSDACTFAPKVNPPRKPTEDNNDEPQLPAPGSPPIRSKFQATQQPPSPPIKSKFQSQQPPEQPASPPPSPPKRRTPAIKKATPVIQANDSSDSLDRLKGSYTRPKAKEAPSYQDVEPEEPEHDALSNELKTRTGKVIAREPKPKITSSGGECLRNSSCKCRQCDPSSPPVASNNAPLARQRQMKPSPSLVDTASEVDQNSLSLLKSKMSRRKSRSAPTKPASMFVDEDKPRHVMHSAREPPSKPMAEPEPRAAPRRPVPPPAAFVEPANVFSGVPDGESEVQDDGAHHECPDCHRKFNATAIVKHQKICKKVFQGPKKVFNMAAARLKGTEVEKLLQEKGVSLKAVTTAPAKAASKQTEEQLKKAADWKKKSNAFRDAIKSSRDYEIAKKEGRELPPPPKSEIDPSLIQCQHCSRRFNEKAAERHIPHCKEKADRAALSHGPPKKTPGGGKPAATKLAPPKPVVKTAAKKK